MGHVGPSAMLNQSFHILLYLELELFLAFLKIYKSTETYRDNLEVLPANVMQSEFWQWVPLLALQTFKQPFLAIFCQY